ncbi:hypothetical protein SISSUDRAFT_1067685 [Sistotremastrum suecicum HHB10207 ss-3]|uniref:DUF4219 domain-containing protein n=1 Tax=Sistotremastrum suecicum HHB10207 ss-3 TaxID=1314776 RepID=A0A165WU90_9AGAM|nr:hypothetical protein SISSUDRAFT_1067685 [Sistotremastrum suecicum HHB10207 ss-3]
MSTDTKEKTTESTGSQVPNLIRAKGHETSNFHTWKIQLQAVFKEQELWDVVYGKEKANMPTLYKTKTIKADVDGVVRDVKQIGNEFEEEKALVDNAGWNSGTMAVTWARLYNYFSTTSSRESGAKFRQISTYKGEEDMDIDEWLTDMRKLYSGYKSHGGTNRPDSLVADYLLLLLPDCWTHWCGTYEQTEKGKVS